ncbi:TRAP transporter TatT component family protein [Thermodesulfobacteriota bacterium]
MSCFAFLPTTRCRQLFGPAGYLIILFSGVCLLTGCSALLSSATGNLADNLTQAIVNNNDLETVETGGPAYLLMVDGLLHGDPENESLLRAGATLYSAYAGVFVQDKPRAKRLTERGLQYGLRALCASNQEACEIRKARFKPFSQIINTLNVEDVSALFALGTAWAGWIQARSEDFNAIAEISRVEVIMERIIILDETYQDGGAHLYLGVLATLIPPALGGKPDVGKKHFERAIELSRGRNLMVKVIYARQYARLLFKRQLHDRLLREVISADPNVPDYTLMNTLAQRQAEELLKSADEYF